MITMITRAAARLRQLREKYARTPWSGVLHLPSRSEAFHSQLWTWAETVDNHQLAPQYQRIRHDQIFVHPDGPGAAVHVRVPETRLVTP